MLVAAIRAGLAVAGDSTRASQQQAYMKSDLPFRGLSAPELRALVNPLLRDHPLPDRVSWESAVRELWDGATHREEWYAALAVLRYRRYADWLAAEIMPLLEHLVRVGAWWDVVDEISAHLVGKVLMAERSVVTPRLQVWSVDEHLWLRRSAVLSQLRHKSATDTALLSQVLLANGEGTRHGGDFFIRKALGWALREYARTDADWVRQFVADNAECLSPLTQREALKHLGRPQTGTSSTAPTA